MEILITCIIYVLAICLLLMLNKPLALLWLKRFGGELNVQRKKVLIYLQLPVILILLASMGAYILLIKKFAVRWNILQLLMLLCLFCPVAGLKAASSLCVRVKIEIVQTVTLERQGFRATMKVSNGGEADLAGFQAAVNFADEQGNSVAASTNPNASPNDFAFLRSALRALLKRSGLAGQVEIQKKETSRKVAKHAYFVGQAKEICL